MKLSIKGQGHSLTLVKGHSDFKVKCLTFGPYTQVSNSGPHGPLVCTVEYGVCVINSSNKFQWMLLKLCRHILDILKMCMWGFDGARINF